MVDVGTLSVVRESGVLYGRCSECGAQLQMPELSGFMIRSPSDVADRMMVTLGMLDHEELRVLALSTRNRVIGEETVYVGNVSSALVRVGELFRLAVRLNAKSVILVHNHPSGDVTPSPDDLHLTAEALAAGRLLDIDVLDHLVVGRAAYVSLRDRGVVFDRVR